MAEFVEDLLLGTEEEAEKKNEQNVGRAIASIYEGLEGYQGGLTDDVLPLLEEALAVFGDEFPAVLGELDRAAESSTAAASQAYAQDVGAGEQDLISQGMGYGSVRESHRMGAKQRHLQTLSDINASLATSRSSVRMGGLGMKLDLIGNLAGMFERSAGAEFEAGKAEAAFRSGVSYQGTPGMVQEFGRGFARSMGESLGGKPFG